jgi:parallel beta-helix repeat protein
MSTIRPSTSGLTPHDPIYINGNDNFTPANGVVGGSGTENDPYIIEGWAISAENVYGIWIENTTAHFVIRNCLVKNSYGIYLKNVAHGKIENCTLENNFNVRLFYSDNNIISNNIVEKSWY